MGKLTLNDAETIAGRGRPWTLRMEFTGTNSANAGGVSNKYWFATGRGLSEQVEIGWGALGSTPQYQLIDWTELRNRVADKLSKGYVYQDTPYIRMSAGNLAKVMGNPVAAPATAVSVSSLTQAPRPAPRPAAAPVAAPAPSPTMSGTGPNLLLAALGLPYNLIRSLRMTRDGVKVTGYDALDANGVEVLQFNPTEGVDFARQYQVDVMFN